jgi:glycine oxidase
MARRVAIVGGGIIGLTCAWRLLRAGCEVTVLDSAVAAGATHAAAGMIAPASEAVFGQDALLGASLASARLWPGFAAELVHDSGRPVDLAEHGTLLVAADADDETVLARHARHLERQGCAVERLTSRVARRLEPALSPRLSGALLLRDEASVDPRVVAEALVEAVRRLGGTIRELDAEPVVRAGVVRGVLPLAPAEDEGCLAADVVVVAAGWCSPGVLAALGHPLPIRPLKGQVLRLGAAPDILRRTVRATVRGREVYLVPRPDGEVVVGATSEDVGPDTTTAAGAVHDLLHDAIEVLPELAEAELREAIARLRPATADNLPVVGATCVDGLVIAAGHGRDGVLLAPITGDTVVAQVCGGDPPLEADSFAAQRFCMNEEHE